MASECKLRQITFSHDKESKILSFTGKVEKKKVQILQVNILHIICLSVMI